MIVDANFISVASLIVAAISVAYATLSGRTKATHEELVELRRQIAYLKEQLSISERERARLEKREIDLMRQLLDKSVTQAEIWGKKPDDHH